MESGSREKIDWLETSPFASDNCLCRLGACSHVLVLIHSTHEVKNKGKTLTPHFRSKNKISHHWVELCNSAWLYCHLLGSNRVYSDLGGWSKGFRNTNGQIAASFTANGKFVISASEDSYVYIWNYDSPNTPAARNQGVCRAYEYLSSRSVSAAIPWPGMKPEPLVSHQGELLSGHRYNLELMLQGPLNAGRKSGSFPQVAICQVSEGSIHNASYVSMSGNSEAWLSSAERNANISEGIRVRDIIERYVPEIKKPHVFVTCNGKASVFRNIRADASIISDSMSGSLQANLTASSASHRALDHSSPNHGFWAETLSKGSATWPEEKLSPLSNQFPSNLAVAEPPNSLYETGDGTTIQDHSSTVAWDLVIVTAYMKLVTVLPFKTILQLLPGF